MIRDSTSNVIEERLVDSSHLRARPFGPVPQSGTPLPLPPRGISEEPCRVATPDTLTIGDYRHNNKTSVNRNQYLISTNFSSAPVCHIDLKIERGLFRVAGANPRAGTVILRRHLTPLRFRPQRLFILSSSPSPSCLALVALTFISVFSRSSTPGCLYFTYLRLPRITHAPSPASLSPSPIPPWSHHDSQPLIHRASHIPRSGCP